MTEFGQLVAVLSAGVTTTIGVCVYLLKTQQAERKDMEIRSEKRIDSMFKMLDERIGEQTEVNRDLTKAIQAFDLRLQSLEQGLLQIDRP